MYNEPVNVHQHHEELYQIRNNNIGKVGKPYNMVVEVEYELRKYPSKMQLLPGIEAKEVIKHQEAKRRWLRLLWSRVSEVS